MKQLSAGDFAAFIADGNVVAGPLPMADAKFSLQWTGSGCRLEFGKDVQLRAVKILFHSEGTIAIGEGSLISGSLVIDKGSQIRIGEQVRFNRVCDIRAQEGATITIGSECLFSNARILTSDLHSILDLETGERLNPARSIVIEDRVWLAEDVKIMKGARVGEGAVIGAGALVNKPIAPFCLAVGSPARIVRTGISWDRWLKKAPPTAAQEFDGADIPLEVEVLRRLVASKRYALTIKAIEHAIREGCAAIDLPVFARWYLVSCRHRLNRNAPDDYALLQSVLRDAPNHAAAAKLYAQWSAPAQA